MATKMTKRDYFNILRGMESVKANPDMVAFIDHELELLAKKNSADKKPTAAQVANEGLKESILSFMKPGEMYTVSDLIKTVPACEGLSNQKVSSLLRQMKDDGIVVRTEDKRKAYFSLPAEDTSEG